METHAHTRQSAAHLCLVRHSEALLTGVLAGRTPEDRVAVPIAEEDRLRAATYGQLGNLLARVPDSETLERLRSVDADVEAGGLPGAWARLGAAARSATTQDLEAEYQNLFIGIGRGELVPYASWYLTGFLMERPLGILREELSALGISRQDRVREPEDHIAALCEVMALLIGDPDCAGERQGAFFVRHLAPWAGRFFDDLERAATARFYRQVGRLGRHFIELEQQYLGDSG